MPLRGWIHVLTVHFSQTLWGAQIVYGIAMMLTQNVFLFQYRKIFVGRWQRLINNAMIMVVTLFGLSSIVVFSLQCTPTQEIWDPFYQGEFRCINYSVFWTFAASLNTLTALVVWILPLPVIRSLNLPKRQKYWLMVVFLLGFL